MTGSHDFGDSASLSKSNSSVDPKLHDPIQDDNSQKNSTALLVGRCQLLLELEANPPPPEETKRSLDHLN